MIVAREPSSPVRARSPRWICRSEPQIFDIPILTSIAPGSSSGSGYSRHSKRFDAQTYAAALLAAVVLLLREGSVSSRAARGMLDPTEAPRRRVAVPVLRSG